MVQSLDELKRMVFSGESGGDYNALFGYANRPGRQFAGVNVTDMTVDQALQFASPSGAYGQFVKSTRPDPEMGVATPLGAWQVVGKTLAAAKTGLGLTGSERMTPELQDQIGMWIYQNQGPGAWQGWGKGGGSGSRSSGGGAMPMGLFDMQEEPQTFGERLKRDWKSGELLDRIALAANSLRLEPDPNLAQVIQARQERRTLNERGNRTIEWLAQQPDGAPFVQMITAGGDPATVIKLYQEHRTGSDTPAAFRSLEAQAKAAGLKPGTKEYQDFMLYGGGTKDEIPAAFRALDMQAKAAGLEPGTPEYENFMLTRGAYDTALGRAAGAAAGAAQIDLQGAALSAGRALKMVDEILADPALPDMVGPIQGLLPNISPAAQRFQSRLNQLKGTAFLEAYNMLRGGGQITENEGNKAEQAMIRLNTAQTEEDFRLALQDFKDAVTMGYQKLQARAGGGSTFSGTTNAPASGFTNPPTTDDPLGLRQPATGG